MNNPRCVLLAVYPSCKKWSKSWLARVSESPTALSLKLGWLLWFYCSSNKYTLHDFYSYAEIPLLPSNLDIFLHFKNPFLFPFGFGMQIQAMFITALQETWSFLHFCTCVKCQPAKGTLEFIVSLTTDNILTFLGKFHSEKQQWGR